MAQRSDGDSSAQRSNPRRHASIAAIAVCSSAFAIAALAAPVDDLRTAVEAGDSAAAYARYCATSIDVAERPPEFDLWCGVAAVDIGRSGEGVLALERYVLQFPEDARARLELARAYFYAGDDVRSREEFEAVARGQPPPEVQAGIDRYLAALTDREARYRGRRTAFVELGGGYDSNANAGVAQATIGLPVLGPVTVDAFGVQKESAFGWLAAGAEIPPSSVRPDGRSMPASTAAARSTRQPRNSIWRITARQLARAIGPIATSILWRMLTARSRSTDRAIAGPTASASSGADKSRSCLRSRLRRNTRASVTPATTPHAMPI